MMSGAVPLPIRGHGGPIIVERRVDSPPRTPRRSDTVTGVFRVHQKPSENINQLVRRPHRGRDHNRGRTSERLREINNRIGALEEQLEACRRNADRERRIRDLTEQVQRLQEWREELARREAARIEFDEQRAERARRDRQRRIEVEQVDARLRQIRPRAGIEARGRGSLDNMGREFLREAVSDEREGRNAALRREVSVGAGRGRTRIAERVYYDDEQRGAWRRWL